jgi:hypothetical protein
MEIALIAGAADTTTGNIAIQAISQDKSQWLHCRWRGKTGDPGSD